MLKTKNLQVAIGDLKLLDDVSLELCAGQWLMVIGPNGAGKSTLISALTKSIPYAGITTLNGKDIKNISPRDLALSIGVLAQKNDINYSFSVEEVVALGRYAHSSGIFPQQTDKDQEKVEYALRVTGLLDQRRQSVLTLSGGELQRTFLAQLFAQDPCILLLDEPTNHLDIKFQAQLFDLIQQWLDQGSRAVLSVVHDLSLAQLYGNQAMLLHHGQVISSGDKPSVFTRENLNSVYQMDVINWMNRLYSHWKDQAYF